MFIYLIFGLDLKSHLFNFIWASESVINKSASLSLIGLLAFQIGYIRKRKRKIKKEITSSLLIFYSKKNSSNFLIILTYLFYFIFIISDNSYRSGNYELEKGIGRYLFLAYNILLISSITTKLVIFNNQINKISFLQYLKQLGPSLLVITFWHILYSLYIGDRGPVISYSIMILGIYFFKYYNVKFYQLIIIIIFGAFFLTLIGKARRLDVRGGMISKISTVSKENSLSNRFENSVPMEQTVELALSIRCLNHSILNVPGNYRYQLGFFQLKQIISIFPWGSSIMLKITGKDKKYDGSTNFITYLIQGENPVSGDGTTVVADLYLDMGVIGVIIGLFIFGIFIKCGEDAILNGANTFFLWISIFIYFAFSLYTGRATLLFQLKPIFMAYIVATVNYNIMKFYAK